MWHRFVFWHFFKMFITNTEFDSFAYIKYNQTVKGELDTPPPSNEDCTWHCYFTQLCKNWFYLVAWWIVCSNQPLVVEYNVSSVCYAVCVEIQGRQLLSVLVTLVSTVSVSCVRHIQRKPGEATSLSNGCQLRIRRA